MRLHTELVLKQVRVLTMKTVPTKEDPIIHIPLRVSLTPEVAESFGCRELIYAGNVPRSGVANMALEGSEIDCEVHFEHANWAFSAVASEVSHFVAKMEGEGPQLVFVVKLTGYAEIVSDLANKVKIDPLEVTLKPAQMDLGLQKKKERTCVDCANEIGFMNGDMSTHLSGQPCADYEPPPAEGAAEESDGPALASVGEVEGFNKRKKKRSTREPIDAEPVEEEEVDFMKDIEEPAIH